MRKITSILLSIVLIANLILPLSVFAAADESIQPGWKIYDPMSTVSDRSNYRYGPSIMLEDNVMHVWSASGGKDGEWDWINYTKSTDGGHTWSDETVALRPTPGSEDRYSNCDPGVIKIGGYYYIGYTSTEDTRGLSNNVFVGRSKNPDGPYEKWDGTGWGGAAKPIVTFDGAAYAFGSGEPSFVEKDGTLYIYYSWWAVDADGNGFNQTRVSTAPSTDENWPAKMQYKGVAINKDRSNEDSADVKYIDDYGTFIAITTNKRFSDNSYVNFYESKDGIHFKQANVCKDSIQKYLHNGGISSRPNGHISLSDQNVVAYAYGQVWAGWPTFMNPITYTYDELPATVNMQSAIAKNSEVTLYFNTNPGETYTVKYGTSAGQYTETISSVEGSPYTVRNLQNGKKYYFAVVANNANGSSQASEELIATPGDYKKAAVQLVEASSQQTGHEAAKTIDGNASSYWYSGNNSSTPEWISYDLGQAQNVAKVTLLPYEKAAMNYPQEMSILVSEDGQKWWIADVSKQEEGNNRIYYFNTPIYGRYVKIVADKMGTDTCGNYGVKFAETEIESISTTHVETSVSVISISASRIGNGNTWKIFTTARMNDDTKVDVTGSNKITYDEYDPSILNVSSDGTVNEIAKGATWVRITYEGKHASVADLVGSVKSNVIGITATASSILDNNPGYGPSYVLDGNPSPSNSWLSESSTTSSAIQWIALDLGKETTVTNFSVSPRSDGICFPEDFEFQTSTDGDTWTTIEGMSFTGQKDIIGKEKKIIILPQPMNTRYVRLLATKLTAEDVYYRADIGDFSVNGSIAIIATASSTLDNNPGYGPSYVLDGNPSPSNSWLSQSNTTSSAIEWLALDLGKETTVTNFSVSPRSDGICFPEDFTFQTSTDGAIWIDIEGMSFTGQKTTGSQKMFTLPQSMNTRYVRLLATKLTAENGTYRADIGDFSVNGSQAIIATASSTWPGFSPNNAIDGGQGSPWLSGPNTTSSAIEWLALDLGKETAVNNFLVSPRNDGICFPDDFELQTSTDGDTWTTIDGMSFTGQKAITLNQKRIITLQQPLNTRYVRLLATKLTDEGGTYRADIGDFLVNADTSSLDPIVNIEAKYPNLRIPISSTPISLQLRSCSKKGMFQSIDNYATLSDYDSSIISVDSGNKIHGLVAGSTDITVTYLTYTAKVHVTADPEMEDVAWGGIASSGLPGWGAGNLTDKLPTTWASNFNDYNNKDAHEWAGIDLHASKIVKGLVITPRGSGWFFPRDFTLQSSNDAQTWASIKSYTNYPNPGSDKKVFEFDNPVEAQYFRIYADVMTNEGGTNATGMHITEIDIINEIRVTSCTPFYTNYSLTVGGDVKQLGSKAMYSDGSTKLLYAEGDGMSYTGYDASLMNVDEYGVLSAVKTPVIISKGDNTLQTSLPQGGSTAVTSSFKGKETTQTIQVAAADLLGKKLVWSSSNPEVATVNSETGVITCVKSGDTTISYSVTDLITGQILFVGKKNIQVTVSTITGSVITNNTQASATAKAGVVVVEKPKLNTTTGEAKVAVTEDNLNKAIQSASAVNGIKTIKIEVPKTEGAKAYAVELPKSALTLEKSPYKVEVVTELGTIVAPSNMLNESNLTGSKSVGLSIVAADKTKLAATLQKQIGSRPVIEVTVMVDGKPISWNNQQAPMKISIPYNLSASELKDADHIVVWYIDESGKPVAVPNAKYDATTKMVNFTTTHLSKYAVAENYVTFTDAEKCKWAQKQIEVMASKGIIKGTSETEFSPNKSISRAEFLDAVIKCLGLTAELDENFSDVTKSNSFYESIAIAKKLGITSGVGNNRFNPDKDISRQEMSSIVVNAMKLAKKVSSTGTASDLKKFTDASKIAKYAVENMATLVKENILSGNRNKINPTGKVTRAETAAILYNIYK